jgi:hypothetical protein
LDPSGQLVTLVIKVQLDQWGHQEKRAHLEILEHQDNQDLLDFLVYQEIEDP